MVATLRLKQQPTRETSRTGDAVEWLELLRLRINPDPATRVIAMVGCQILRRLDARTKEVT